jgi:UDP-GlcNAc:undecaprenyl-phosphate GlcNAc-1-phosphate transferase
MSSGFASFPSLVNGPEMLLAGLGFDMQALRSLAPTQSQVLTLSLTFVGAFGLGAVGTLLTRTAARRVGFVAKPRAERWHAKPTALAGGVGIFVAFLLAALWVGGPLRLPVLLGAALMFALGLADDILMLRPRYKLSVQLMVAVATALAGPALPWTPFPIVNQAITVFWLVGITNAVNLLDNMDGLSGGVACISALVQGIFFVVQGQAPEAALCFALAGACGGFLLFNFNPASIFMGDAGALFLGYTLASLALHQNYGRSRGLLAVMAGPILVLLIPIFDTTFVTITRMLQGRPISQGGRDHTSHRLVLLGLSERAAVLTLWGLSLCAGAMAFLVRLSIPHALLVGVPMMTVALGLIGVHLARTDGAQLTDGKKRPLASLGAIGYRLRVFEVLLDTLLAVVSLVGAFLLRFDGVIPLEIESKVTSIFPGLVLCKLVALLLSGAYDGLWQHAGVRDLAKLGRGAVLGSALGVGGIVLFAGFESISRGALIIDALLFTALVVCARASFHFLHMILGGQPTTTTRRVLLWGAGVAGELVVRQMRAIDSGVVPVGFIDDNALKMGCTIHGLQVLGDSNRVVELLRDGVADEILITSGAIAEERISNVVQALGEGKVRRVRISFEDISPGLAPQGS